MQDMSSLSLQNNISQIVDSIATQGYAITKHFLSAEAIKLLSAKAKSLQQAGEMQKATTGLAKIEAPLIRGDFIHWIEKDQASDAEVIYLNAMATLQQAINQAFFLGLFELESHFAIYPPGAGYQKHLDQLIGKQERKISCILYLNEGWTASDGGELRMYLDKNDEAKFIDVSPEAGTLVVFLSGDFLHEVLPAKRERMSVTGWFRTRSLNH